jgi:hypothetical protein
VFKTARLLFLTWATFTNIHFNIIPINPSFSSWLLSFGIRDQNLVFVYLLDLLILMTFGENWKSWSSPLCNFLPSPVAFTSQVHIFYAAPYIQTSSTIVRPWGCHTKFRASANYRPNYIAIYCNIYIFGYENRRQAVLNWMVTHTALNVTYF